MSTTSIIRSIRNIMRKDEGVDGDAQRISQMVWMLFMKIFADKEVRFGYKDYRKEGQKKEMTLSHVEFIRRFSLHILPRRFVRIRHYGILSSSWKRGKLQDLQSDLKIQITEVKPKTLLKKCRCCKEGNLITIALFGQRGPPQDFLPVFNASSAK